MKILRLITIIMNLVLVKVILIKIHKNLKPNLGVLLLKGEVEKPITLSAEEIFHYFLLKKESTSLRCVEGWSMVIPWMGFSLSQLLNKVSIKNTAKFVEFESVYDPEQMKGQRYPVLNWPYREGSKN